MFGLVLALLAFFYLRRLRRDLQDLRSRVERLEGPSLEPTARAIEPKPVAPSATNPVAAAPTIADTNWRTLLPPLNTPQQPPRPTNLSHLENLVGGVWLQNLGAVLLLIGVFFLIVWGWTTGRFGPEVLVAAGVLIGAVLVWRGDRVRESMPGFGHSLIGVGFGVAYVTLYLGHFTLRVLPTPVAIATLIATSVLAAVAGLRYHVQSIAALGVIGAYLPQLLAGIVPLRGFSLPPLPLLGWIGAVGALAFVLSARSGWSALNLTSIALSAVVWSCAFPRGDWGWGVTLGLAALFSAYGLAPLPRLMRTGDPVRAIDLAVIALAPFALIGAAWPMLVHANARYSGLLFLGLAAIHALAAAWVDVRRSERDLWRPLTGAAALFLAAALQRMLGHELTPMAWTLEGALLVSLGVAPRAGWLRVCGGVMLVLGATWGFIQTVEAAPSSVPPLSPLSVYTLVIVLAMLGTGFVLGRNRGALTREERSLPEIAILSGHALLALWFAREAWSTAYAFEGAGGVWRRLPSLEGPGADVRTNALATAIMSLVWAIQAGWLAWAGAQAKRLALRLAAGTLLAFLTIASLLALIALEDPWGRDWLLVLHAPGILHFTALAVIVAVAGRLAIMREALTEFDRRAPEVWGLAAALVLMAWSAREADHTARIVLGLPGSGARHGVEVAHEALRRHIALASVFTSIGWLFQALLTMVAGWWRGSAFLRWMGLALVGVTAVKFVLRDLAGADPFWRFLTAIVAGVVMLAVSWAYQRRSPVQAQP
jgi:uncharacterized membrane protein